MSSKKFNATAYSYDRENENLSFNGTPDFCPVCKRGQTCTPHHIRRPRELVCSAFFECIFDDCRAPFIGIYKKHGDGRYYFKNTEVPSYSKDIEDIPEVIDEISPDYRKIYNQAAKAENEGLDLIIGCGYRKALEFLIKDYSIGLIVGDGNEEELNDEERDKIEKIKKATLGKVINTYLEMPKVKSLAARATWLGNDETHYERRIENGDISVMKSLMRLVIHFIEAEEEAKKLEAEIQPAK